MQSNWEKYQEEVAAFFRLLGLDARVEEPVEGARGIHDTDVWVTFTQYGLTIKWIVECKLWRTPIPKEKVLTLYQIAQDVGADRAFLLSESGFQAGAIQAARNTNVTLTSLDELRASAAEELLEIEFAKVGKRIVYLDRKLCPFYIDDEGHPFPHTEIDRDKVMSLMSTLFTLRLAIPKASAAQFPVLTASVNSGFIQSYTLNEFVQKGNNALGDVESEISNLEALVTTIQQRCSAQSQQLIEAVENLMHNADIALFEGGADDPEFEQNRLQALDSMRAVGRLSSEVKLLARRDIQVKLHGLMRCLIDTVYLQLTEPTVSRTAWNKTVEAVKDATGQFRNIAVINPCSSPKR